MTLRPIGEPHTAADWHHRVTLAAAALIRSRILRTHNPDCPCPLPTLYVIQCLTADHYNDAGQPVHDDPHRLAIMVNHPSMTPIRMTAAAIICAARHALGAERTTE